MKTKLLAPRVLLVLALSLFTILAAVPAGALPPREGGGLGCFSCRWWPFLGSLCWPANLGRSECEEYPTQGCSPFGAFCEVIIVIG